MEETDASGPCRPPRDAHPGAPAAVFAFLTDPEKIPHWMGTATQVEPQPSGLYPLNVTGARLAGGCFRDAWCRCTASARRRWFANSTAT